MTADEKDLIEGNYARLSGTQKFWLWIVVVLSISIGAICLAYVGGKRIEADAKVESDKILSQWAAKEWAWKFGPGKP